MDFDEDAVSIRTHAEQSLDRVFDRAQLEDPRVRRALRPRAATTVATMLEESGAERTTLPPSDEKVAQVLNAVAPSTAELQAVPGVERPPGGPLFFDAYTARTDQREQAWAEASALLLGLAAEAGQAWTTWFDRVVTDYLAAHPDAVALPDEVRAHTAGAFLLAQSPPPDRVRWWANAAYQAGRTGEPVLPADASPRQVAVEKLPSNAQELQDLLARAHYLGRVDRDHG